MVCLFSWWHHQCRLVFLEHWCRGCGYNMAQFPLVSCGQLSSWCGGENSLACWYLFQPITSVLCGTEPRIHWCCPCKVVLERTRFTHGELSPMHMPFIVDVDRNQVQWCVGSVGSYCSNKKLLAITGCIQNCVGAFWIEKPVGSFLFVFSVSFLLLFCWAGTGILEHSTLWFAVSSPHHHPTSVCPCRHHPVWMWAAKPIFHRCIFLTALCITDAVLEIYCIRIVDYSLEPVQVSLPHHPSAREHSTGLLTSFSVVAFWLFNKDWSELKKWLTHPQSPQITPVAFLFFFLFFLAYQITALW